MEVVRFSATTVDFYQSTRRHSPKDHNLRDNKYFGFCKWRELSWLLVSQEEFSFGRLVSSFPAKNTEAWSPPNTVTCILWAKSLQKWNESRTHSVKPLGLKNVSIDTVELPPASGTPPVDTPCNTKDTRDNLTDKWGWRTYTPQTHNTTRTVSQNFVLPTGPPVPLFFIKLTARASQILQISARHFQIPGARRVTWSKLICLGFWGLPMACGLSWLTSFEYETKVFRNVVVSQPKPQTVGKPKNLQMSTVIVITTDLWRWNRQSSETSSSANLSHTVGKPKNQETSFEWRRKLRNTVNQGPCRGPSCGVTCEPQDYLEFSARFEWTNKLQ